MSAADEAIKQVPEEERKGWLSPAIVYAGVEFSIPVIMVGTGLVQSFSLYSLAVIVAIGLAITWVGDSLMAYVGAMTGRPSTVIARSSFGTPQARTIVSAAVAITGLGWWGVQTAVMADAVSQVLGISQAESWLLWALVVVILGLIFAAPAISGYQSMEWTDYIAVPSGLLILLVGVYLAVQQYGIETITQPIADPTMTFTTAISTVIGVNAIQWVMISDYSRQHHPTVKDSILMPSLIVIVGFVLMMIGGVMAIGMGGDYNLVHVMAGLGFPFWGYLMLFFAQWTSQLVNVYSPGLAIANSLDWSAPEKRKVVTFGVTLFGILLALAGILSQYQNFLLLIGIAFPAIGAIMITDFLVLRKQQYREIDAWNWVATITLVIAFGFGYYTQYIYSIGLPAVQTYIVSTILYYGLMRVKASVSPGAFTPNHWKA